MAENSFDLTVITNLRKKQGLTAEELAARAGLTRSTVAKLESGRSNPTLETLRAIAGVLGVAASELLALSEVHRQTVGQTRPFSMEGMDGIQVILPGVELFHLHLRPGASAAFDPHLHENTSEVCLVLAGEVEIGVGGRLYQLEQGRALSFRALQQHSLRTVGGCQLLLMHHNPAQ